MSTIQPLQTSFFFFNVEAYESIAAAAGESTTNIKNNLQEAAEKINHDFVCLISKLNRNDDFSEAFFYHKGYYHKRAGDIVIYYDADRYYNAQIDHSQSNSIRFTAAEHRTNKYVAIALMILELDPKATESAYTNLIGLVVPYLRNEGQRDLHVKKESERLESHKDDDLKEHYQSYSSTIPSMHQKECFFTAGINYTQELVEKYTTSLETHVQPALEEQITKHINTYVTCIFEAERSRTEYTFQYAATAIPLNLSVLPRIIQKKPKWSITYKGWEMQHNVLEPFTATYKSYSVQKAPQTYQIIYYQAIKFNDVVFALI